MRENMLEYRGFANAKYGIIGNRYDRDTNFI